MPPDGPPPATTDPFAAGAVPIPNTLFDAMLPTLKDTELRVLLIVLRQTIGRRDKQGRAKSRDWLSHAQLVKRTGRGSDAVSSAIAALVRRGLIQTETSTGTPLGSPAERRRYLGRLYFRASLGENLGKSGDPSHPVKAERTTNNENKISQTDGTAAPEDNRAAAVEPLARSGWQRAVPVITQPAQIGETGAEPLAVRAGPLYASA